MKSTTGEHWLALDHIRAFAALLVFCWHFMRVQPEIENYTAPIIVPLALPDEGHVGVALFMTLSGYLFAKLLDGKNVALAPFLRNRLLRLMPLLFIVFALGGALELWRGGALAPILLRTVEGFVLPVWSNGGWSIAIELHFYLLLPFLLPIARKSPYGLILIVLAAILIRSGIYATTGNISAAGYWTIFGRIDQFVLGMLAWQHRQLATRTLAIAAMVLFVLFYWGFDALGGLHIYGDLWRSSPVWILMPTIEGIAFAIIIAWYDSSAPSSRTLPSRLIGRIGTYSYSIYLLHFFYFGRTARFIDGHVMDLSNFYVNFLWAVISFLAFVPIAAMSYHFVERPFLKFRRDYRVQVRDGEATEKLGRENLSRESPCDLLN